MTDIYREVARVAYALIADALTALFDGNDPGLEKAIGQMVENRDVATATCSSMLGMLQAHGVTSAKVRTMGHVITGSELPREEETTPTGEE